MFLAPIFASFLRVSKILPSIFTSPKAVTVNIKCWLCCTSGASPLVYYRIYVTLCTGRGFMIFGAGQPESRHGDAFQSIMGVLRLWGWGRHRHWIHSRFLLLHTLLMLYLLQVKPSAMRLLCRELHVYAICDDLCLSSGLPFPPSSPPPPHSPSSCNWNCVGAFKCAGCGCSGYYIAHHKTTYIFNDIYSIKLTFLLALYA